jgi:alpha-beta hydrolase superfamily lysophospholipase
MRVLESAVTQDARSPRRRRAWRAASAAAALFAALVNFMAYRHARVMTHFSPGGARTARPEQLSLAERLGVLVTGANLPKPNNRRTPADEGLGFERQVFASRDGLSLEAWYVPRPDALGTVVLFHGYADSKDSLLPAAKAFHEIGYATLVVDFRGSGGSDGNVTTIGYHEALDVVAAYQHAQRLEPRGSTVLFGASMGAAAVLRAAAALEARPAAIVLQYPFGTLREALLRRFAAMRVPAFPAVDLLVVWGGLQHGFNGYRHNPVDYAKRVRSPTLLMQGDRDERVSMDEARAIFGALPEPKQLKVFDGLGHVSFVKARRQEWLSTVREFLAGALAAPADSLARGR